jgi:hypothetical protein
MKSGSSSSSCESLEASAGEGVARLEPVSEGESDGDVSGRELDERPPFEGRVCEELEPREAWLLIEGDDVVDKNVGVDNVVDVVDTVDAVDEAVVSLAPRLLLGGWEGLSCGVCRLGLRPRCASPLKGRPVSMVGLEPGCDRS